MANNFFLPFYNYTLTTSLSPQEIIHKLGNIIDENSPAVINSKYAKQGSTFTGYIGQNEFKVTLIQKAIERHINDIDPRKNKNPALSIKIVSDFFGKITVENGVTTVAIKAKLGILTTIIMSLLIFLPPIMALASAGDRDKIPMQGVLLFSLLAYFITIIGFGFTASDTQKILDDIITGETD